ncbi:nitroreductase family protein [Sneathiella limimaris]|uniref:nitroreductase family protein n=1 Tax=Sneathiella limimaris TaxID=1964213 RepID=UPI00146E4D9C
MQLVDAIRSRKSVRQFTDKPVSKEVIEEILEMAKWAPSGGNLQPWTVHVLVGDDLKTLLETIQDHMKAGRMETPEYNVYPPDLKDPYRTRRRIVGQQLYDLIGVPREDTAGKLRQLAKNYEFFGAPVGMFFVMDRQMEIGQFADLGMFLQNIMLMAREKGLQTCPQEAWARWPNTVSKHLELSDDEMMFCGLALGYEDDAAKINELQSERASLSEFVTWRGFD